MSDCWICRVSENEPILFQDEYCVAFLDTGPVTKDHILVTPKRHIENIFEATDSEILSIFQTIKKCFEDIQKKDSSIIGYNIGINCGKVAGQTASHLHVHLIPRRIGDTKNPTGGVRGVIPEKMHEIKI